MIIWYYLSLLDMVYDEYIHDVYVYRNALLCCLIMMYAYVGRLFMKCTCIGALSLICFILW